MIDALARLRLQAVGVAQGLMESATVPPQLTSSRAPGCQCNASGRKGMPTASQYRSTILLGVFEQVVAVHQRRRRTGLVAQAVEQLPLLGEPEFLRVDLPPSPVQGRNRLQGMADQETVVEVREEFVVPSSGRGTAESP